MTRLRIMLLLALTGALAAIHCEGPPVKAEAPKPALTAVQVDWVRECAKHLEGPDIRGKAAMVVGQCRARARLLW